MALYRMVREGSWPVGDNPLPGVEKMSDSEAALKARTVSEGEKRAKKRSSANTAPESRDNDGTHRNIGMTKERNKTENTNSAFWLKN
jgi:hypothetical protein